MRNLILMLSIACSCSTGANAFRSVSASPNESEVQAAVLDSFFVRPGIDRLVVVDSTVRGSDHFVDEDYAAALHMLGDLPDGIQGDFEQKRLPTKIQRLATRVPVVLFSAQDRAALRGVGNPSEYWRRFYARFPASSGRLAISRVGFSRDGRHALMLVDYGCGGRCGGTVYYLLVRDGPGWRTVRTAQPRIS